MSDVPNERKCRGRTRKVQGERLVCTRLTGRTTRSNLISNLPKLTRPLVLPWHLRRFRYQA